MRIAHAVLLWLASLTAHADFILSAPDARIAAGAPIYLRLTSAPFTDSSYRPRLFFADDVLTKFMDGRVQLGLEAGAGHESNGKEGEDSRSFNMLYVRPTLTIRRSGRLPRVPGAADPQLHRRR